MNARRLLLQAHLVLGLAAGLVLLSTAVTGAAIAFAPDLDAWVHPELYRVRTAATPWPARALWARALAAGAAGAGGEQVSVSRVSFAGPQESWRFDLSNGARVFVDPHAGAVLGVRRSESRLERLMATLFQFHVRLLAGNTGQFIVDAATLLLLLLIPTGIVLWSRTRRLSLRRGTNSRRLIGDLHNVTGLYSAPFVLALAVTGALLAWEAPLYWLTGAKLERERAVPNVIVPPQIDEDTPPAGDPDAWLSAARRALPGLRVVELAMPVTAHSAAQVIFRPRGGIGRSVVFVDRYDAHVVRIDEFAKGPRAVCAHFVVRAIHVGSVGGALLHALLALASLSVAALALTGTWMWARRVMR